MKAQNLFILIALLLFSRLSIAQLKVDNSGRAIFGKQAYEKAISIVDETTSGVTYDSPFRITYKSNQWVTLSRNSYGTIAFSANGGIKMGYNLPTSDSYIPLEVYGVDYAGGIKVFQTSSSAYNGISVDINASSNTYPYVASKGGSQFFM